MVTFSELVETVEHLSQEEMEELRDILRKKLMEKREQEILKASEDASREYEEGKTISLSSPQEIKSYFNDLMNENN